MALHEPVDCVREPGDPDVRLADLHEAVPLDRLRHDLVERHRRQRERFLAALEPELGCTPEDVCPAGAPPADDLEPPVVDPLAMVERPLAILEALLPVSQRDRGETETPERPAYPPHVAALLEDRERALARLDAFVMTTRVSVDLREEAVGRRAQLIEARRLRDRRCLATVRDRGIRARARQTV